LWETVLSGQVWRGEIVNRRKDGSLYTEEQTITPVRDESGEITHFIAIKLDVSERKRSEAARHRRMAELAMLHAGALAGASATDEYTLLESDWPAAAAGGGQRERSGFRTGAR
jgi:hypothetical protein